MSQGPESRFWNTLKSSMPPKSFAQRVENRAGGGVPDVFGTLSGLPFWAELKATKVSTIKIAPHQVAWHTSFWAHGGISFFLINALSFKEIRIIEGREAVNVAQNPRIADHGRVFGSKAEVWEALRADCVAHYAGLMRKV